MVLRHNPAYRRLKVPGRGLLGTASYWLGADHLLVVVTSSYVETYRRFLFSDLQALVIQKNRMRSAWNLVWSVFAVICLASGLSLLGSSLPGAALLLGLAAVFALLLLINTLAGPTCTCSLRTAVQTSQMPYLTRWSQAQRLAAALSPLALKAQGGAEAAAGAAPNPESAQVASSPATPGAGAEDANAPPRIVS